ncbi:hypothetical protein [uncultured Novosphingobium sp.]|uniref:hypothetical protein n=1 Tax=uncultured Novosphingobium sp. TaxID=292277 RepID=UPI0025835E46|nr:hypothetical protein [uncultured Novosphingobium sp.]
MIADVFLREIPAALQAGIRSGQLDVYGSVIRNVSNGQIAGFLQETSALSKVAALVNAGPAAPLQLVSAGVQILQNEQIKTGISAVQQSLAVLNELQIANLALGAAGIGVTAVGFAVMSKKIDRVREDVRVLDGKLDRLLDEFARDRTEKLDDMFDRLRGLAERIDMRWSMSGDRAALGWQHDADEVDRLSTFFAGRARRLLDARADTVIEATPLLDAFAMASGMRIGALALAGETQAAVQVARDDAARMEQMTGRIGAADLARAWLESSQWQAAPGSDAAGEALALASTHARSAATTLRAREAVAATRASPLLALESQGMLARDWLGAAREEQEAPLLLMTAI